VVGAIIYREQIVLLTFQSCNSINCIKTASIKRFCAFSGPVITGHPSNPLGPLTLGLGLAHFLTQLIWPLNKIGGGLVNGSILK
jgi:hypothetical protein